MPFASDQCRSRCVPDELQSSLIAAVFVTCPIADGAQTAAGYGTSVAQNLSPLCPTVAYGVGVVSDRAGLIRT